MAVAAMRIANLPTLLPRDKKEAPPLHTLRPDVPPELSAVVARLRFGFADKSG